MYENVKLGPTKLVTCDDVRPKQGHVDKHRPIYSRRGDRPIVIGYAG